jgi:hypothetical protein
MTLNAKLNPTNTFLDGIPDAGPYPIKNDAGSPWSEARLIVNGKLVTWGVPITLFRAQPNEVIVQAPNEIARRLKLALVEVGGLTFDVQPKQDVWQEPEEEQFKWMITPEQGKSGKGALLFYSLEVTEVWDHNWSVISANLADEIEFKLDGHDQDPGELIKLYRDTTHEFTLLPRAGSPLKDSAITALWRTFPVGLDVAMTPAAGHSQVLTTSGAIWRVDCGDAKDGVFSLRLNSDLFNGLYVDISAALNRAQNNLLLLQSRFPVVNLGQELVAQVKVVSASSHKPRSSVEVAWSFAGTPLPSSMSDGNGLAHIRFTPENTGNGELVASITDAQEHSLTMNCSIVDATESVISSVETDRRVWVVPGAGGLNYLPCNVKLSSSGDAVTGKEVLLECPGTTPKKAQDVGLGNYYANLSFNGNVENDVEDMDVIVSDTAGVETRTSVKVWMIRTDSELKGQLVKFLDGKEISGEADEYIFRPLSPNARHQFTIKANPDSPLIGSDIFLASVRSKIEFLPGAGVARKFTGEMSWTLSTGMNSVGGYPEDDALIIFSPDFKGGTGLGINMRDK